MVRRWRKKRRRVKKTMLLRSAVLLATAVAAAAEGKAATSKPHIITLVIDDLGESADRAELLRASPRAGAERPPDRARRARRAGWHDTQVHNPASFMTGTFGALAKAGIVLERQHSYKYCSPTRRSSAPASALPPARCGSRLSRPLCPQSFPAASQSTSRGRRRPSARTTFHSNSQSCPRS